MTLREFKHQADILLPDDKYKQVSAAINVSDNAEFKIWSNKYIKYFDGNTPEEALDAVLAHLNGIVPDIEITEPDKPNDSFEEMAAIAASPIVTIDNLDKADDLPF